MDTLCISPRGDRVEEGHSDRERERESDMGGGLMGEMEGGGGTKERGEKGVKGETLSDQIFALRRAAHSFIIFLSGMLYYASHSSPQLRRYL